MAYAKVTVSDGIDIKTIPVGFSWSSLFLGWIVPMWRGEWAVGCLFLLIGISGTALQLNGQYILGVVVSLPAWWLPFCFNRWHLRKLILEKEFKVLSRNNQITDAKLHAELGIDSIPYVG